MVHFFYNRGVSVNPLFIYDLYIHVFASFSAAVKLFLASPFQSFVHDTLSFSKTVGAIISWCIFFSLKGAISRIHPQIHR